MKITAFNRIELLVHPFFAAENARVKGQAGGLINVTQKDVLADYETLGLVENWKRKVERISKNPYAIMIIVGPQATEQLPGQINHFEGGLGEKKLRQFTQEYRAFLRYAKRTLGRRLFYISNTIGGRQSELGRLMLSRGRAPYRKLRIYAYGEYLGTSKKGQCVDTISEGAKEMMEKFQQMVWKGEKSKTSLVKVKEVHTKKGTQTMSIESQIGFPTLQRAEVLRRLEKKGRISPYFLKFRLSTDPNYDFKRVAGAFNKAWAKRKRK